MYQQFWGYKVEVKLYLGVREQKWLNTTVVEKVVLGHFFLFNFSILPVNINTIPPLLSIHTHHSLVEQ
jgi:hypothetical protein